MDEKIEIGIIEPFLHLSSSNDAENQEMRNPFPYSKYTVWKFHGLSITQILREINFGESRSAKSATLTQLKALNFDFYAFLPLLRLKLTKITKFRMAKMAVL